MFVTDPYEEFAKQNPDLAERIQSIIDKGRSHLEHGLLEEAHREFQKALALFPYVPTALNNLALIAYGEGDSERAVAYLQQLLQFHETEPTANALLARHWAQRGATPLAFAYANRAVQSVLCFLRSSGGSDPSRWRRSLEFACQSLASLGDDTQLLSLYRETGEPELTPVTLVHVAIAFHNRGDFATARRLWQDALQQQPDLSPALIYLDMMDIVESCELLPFALDHRLEMPQPERGRRVWLVRVPSLFIAAALPQLYHGSADEAEEALSLLTGIGIAGLDRILAQVGTDATRPIRIRLLAGLQLLAMDHTDAARQAGATVARGDVEGEEEALWCLLHGLMAEADKSASEAAKLAEEGLKILRNSEAVRGDHPFRQMLTGLAERVGGYSQESGAEKPVPEIILPLPDAQWLHAPLQSEIAETLEDALRKRSRQTVEELAERLGEQEAESLESGALIRRLAMRMRSMHLERVVGSLSPAGREALRWLAGRTTGTMLPELLGWLGEVLPDKDPWAVVEELYRSSLVDLGTPVGLQVEGARSAEHLAVAIPADLQGRFSAE